MWGPMVGTRVDPSGGDCSSPSDRLGLLWRDTRRRQHRQQEFIFFAMLQNHLMIPDHHYNYLFSLDKSVTIENWDAFRLAVFLLFIKECRNQALVTFYVTVHICVYLFILS